MFGIKRILLGGLVCLALAVPSVVHAAPKSPEVLVEKLEKALKSHDGMTIRDIMVDFPENRGRTELLALIADHEAAGTLEYILQEAFGGVVETKWLLADIRIEVVSNKDVCGVTQLKLRISGKELGGPKGHELTCYVIPGDVEQLMFSDGILGMTKKQSQVFTDLLQYRTKLLNKTVEQVAHQKFKSRAEVAKVIEEDLKNAEPTKRFLAEALTPEAGKEFGDKLAKAFKEGFAEALRKAK
jgi:hypothetical protein